jgi:hypothetical protein
LKTSQLIAGYRAIIAHHKGDKSRQEEELQELFNALRKAILQPP